MDAPQLQYWRAEDGYRWRLKAANGQIIAESGEAYTERNDAVEAFNRVAKILVDAQYEVTGL